MGGLSAEDDHAPPYPPTPPRPGALQPPRGPVFCDQKRWPHALLHVAASATKDKPSSVCINCAKIHLSSSQSLSTPFPLLLCSLPLPFSQAASTEEATTGLHWELSWCSLPQGVPSIYTAPLRRYLLIWCSPFPLLN